MSDKNCLNKEGTALENIISRLEVEINRMNNNQSGVRSQITKLKGNEPRSEKEEAGKMIEPNGVVEAFNRLIDRMSQINSGNEVILDEFFKLV